VLVAIGAGPVPPRGDRVVVLPFVASSRELATALASADAFVHAGDQETFGLSALEAMACATPAVLRASAGLAELCDGVGAIGVAAGSAAAFAEQVDALFAGDREQRSQAARARAEASDWERVFPALLGHYQRLVGARAAIAAPLAGNADTTAALQR